MTAPVFVADPDLLVAAARGSTVLLTGSEGRHAVAVRRLTPGDPVEVVDGRGRRARGAVVSAEGRDRLLVDVAEVVDEPVAQPRLVVVQALPKGDRAELAVELLTEVGVDVIVPWSAARCVAVWRGDRAERGLRRWRDAAREAAKQARRSWVPAVEPPASTSDVAGLVAAASAALVLHEEATVRLGSVALPADGDVVLVVGPEGGVAPDELEALVDAGATAVRLGPTVLRTSTAGAVAAALVSAGVGRW